MVLVTEAEFNAAFTANGYPAPGRKHYQYFTNGLGPKGGITRKVEAAMFLTQLMHESGGLQKRREDGCRGPNGCPNKYPTCDEWVIECRNNPTPNVSYYGRGYIQITWASNYLNASRALGYGDLLKREPDRVAEDEGLSWDVSFWYWNSVVRPEVGDGNVEFGRTTRAINGRLECGDNPSGNRLAQRRFDYYSQVFKAFGLPGAPNPGGCYRC